MKKSRALRVRRADQTPIARTSDQVGQHHAEDPAACAASGMVSALPALPLTRRRAAPLRGRRNRPRSPGRSHQRNQPEPGEHQHRGPRQPEQASLPFRPAAGSRHRTRPAAGRAGGTISQAARRRARRAAPSAQSATGKRRETTTKSNSAQRPRREGRAAAAGRRWPAGAGATRLMRSILPVARANNAGPVYLSWMDGSPRVPGPPPANPACGQK